LMLRSLLADRFHLVVRSEKRELPFYAPVPAEDSGRLGSGIIAAKMGSCRIVGDFAGPAPALEPGSPPICGFTWRLRTWREKATPSIEMRGLGVTLSLLARALGNTVNRPVADETNIAGTFDLTLEYAPDDDRLKPNDQPSDSTAASLFTALREQLGLKLESRKGAVEVFVIDHAEKPSDN
jgi:uncharacterized protein (TIGR03435 family)